MRFPINKALLVQARDRLAGRSLLYWIVGGAGSGKTTVCQALSVRLEMPVYDMDAHIYGAYHHRFTQACHPVNTAWSTADNGLAWLLAMSWDEFDSFNQAALPEYLDLLAEDLDRVEPGVGMLIDGGISNPALLAQAIPARQIACLSAPEHSSVQIWEAFGERKAMKEAVYQLPNPKAAWLKFLEFDNRLTHTILKECRENSIPIHLRDRDTSADELAERVSRVWGIQ